MRPVISRTVLVIALLLSASTAGAATFVVNSTDDTDDGACTTTPGGCTLHEAMNATVATAGRDTIAFDPAVFPPGDPAEIKITTTPPVLSDPAGTVVDGAGAGVVISATSQSPHALAFVSAPGTTLAKVRVANLSVFSFAGTGILICGGGLPDCEADVSKPVVENVVVVDNEEDGVRIQGRAVIKARLTNVVARENGDSGINVEAAAGLIGTRIEGCAARSNGSNNGAPGIALRSDGELAATSVSDTVVTENDGIGLFVGSNGTLSKAKLTKVVATRNGVTGISIGGGDRDTGITLTDTVAVENQSGGLFLFGRNLVGTTVKGAVTNRNAASGLEVSADTLTGAKITGVRAVSNDGDGIAIWDVDASGVQVTRSVVTENAFVGLHLRGSKHVVKRVRADSNGAGIQLDGPGSGSVVTRCTAHTNDATAGGAGIHVASGNTNNVLRENAAQLNDGFNLVDDNPNCDGNVWEDNFAVTATACID